ncbi:TMEM165/GDT1 family protein [Marinimicrobium alkaliphilum]|uniref:TMEM165/GDT1 family protein n=1 Tax=Marinimicrobium alkaliphilum TaxID=2202654 RepID=UPI000DBAA288|nr:TMEM165/GDT1 family protein [Marinimicrobium alkaliphilum]
MEAFFGSTLAVAIAEIGDKTQLLALLLVARYHRPWTIAAGILVATLVNHAVSALLGVWLADVIPSQWMSWLIAASFVAVAIWVLIPDKADDNISRWDKYGPFVATCVLFFIAEIGDKTQVATVILAAKYDALIAVILGTTLGMLLANLPVLFTGRWLLCRIPLNVVHWCAFVLFIGFAVITVLR